MPNFEHDCDDPMCPECNEEHAPPPKPFRPYRGKCRSCGKRPGRPVSGLCLECSLSEFGVNITVIKLNNNPWSE